MDRQLQSPGLRTQPYRKITIYERTLLFPHDGGAVETYNEISFRKCSNYRWSNGATKALSISIGPNPLVTPPSFSSLSEHARKIVLDDKSPTFVIELPHL